jgi:hypothetical protein
MERIMYRRVTLEGRVKGWLFEGKPGSKVKFGKYQEYFRSLVDAVREMDRRLMPAAVETVLVMRLKGVPVERPRRWLQDLYWQPTRSWG